MIRSSSSFAQLIAFTIILCGCAHQSPPPDHQLVTEKTTLKSEPQQAVNIDQKGRVTGEARSFRVTKMRTITVNNKLRVQVEVLNDRGRRDVLYYRMRWLDEAGEMIGQYEPWQTESFEGGQSSVLVLDAPSGKPADFRFELKPQY